MLSKDLKIQLATTIRMYHERGWSPATSTNYSFNDGKIWVSRSGVDKSQFHENDFITVDSNGNSVGEFSTIKPSAETLIHCVLYDIFPEAKVILHSHSSFPVALTAHSSDTISFEGYEVQKGFDGETTHDSSISIPVFENTQDMSQFAETLRTNSSRIQHHCFIMRKHGVYAWGKDLFEAKRHLESLEYLCETEYKIRLLNN